MLNLEKENLWTRSTRRDHFCGLCHAVARNKALSSSDSAICHKALLASWTRTHKARNRRLGCQLAIECAAQVARSGFRDVDFGRFVLESQFLAVDLWARPRAFLFCDLEWRAELVMQVWFLGDLEWRPERTHCFFFLLGCLIIISWTHVALFFFGDLEFSFLERTHCFFGTLITSWT